MTRFTYNNHILYIIYDIMSNIHLNVLGSIPFLKILNELEFNRVLNSNVHSKSDDKKIIVTILFVNNLNIKDIKNYLLQNEPVILFLSDRDYIKKNNLKLLNFHVFLELPIDFLSFKEILNILLTKYNYNKRL